MYSVKERGRAQAFVSLGPVLGPILGGVAGGFIVYGTEGWRWLLWSVAIAAGVVNLLCFCCLKESYGPVILARKAKLLNEREGSEGKRYYVDGKALAKNLFARSITRPLRLLFTSPILGFMALYMAL
jgi:MFS family permease